MRTMIIGMRIRPEPGIAFFGMDEVNVALQQGLRVTAVQPGEAFFDKTAEDGESVRLRFSGFSIKIVLDESTPVGPETSVR